MGTGKEICMVREPAGD